MLASSLLESGLHHRIDEFFEERAARDGEGPGVQPHTEQMPVQPSADELTARQASASAGGDMQAAVARLAEQDGEGTSSTEQMAQLTAMGFDEPTARQALVSAGGDLHTAVALLVAQDGEGHEARPTRWSFNLHQP
jgi:hypothetical protein